MAIWHLYCLNTYIGLLKKEMPGVLHVKQLICLAGFLVFLVGCSSKLEPMDEDVVTVPEIGERASAVDNNAPEVEKSAPVSVPDNKYFGLWWRYLGSAELEMLIDRMIVNNQQLQISAQRVVQAKARSIQDYAQTLPEVTTTAGYTLEAPEGGLGSVPKGSSPSSGEEFEVGLNARYTVDIWGERASFAQASQYRLQQSIYEYDARLLQSITDLSKAYLEYLSLNDRIRSAKESDAALSSMLEAMAELYEQGDATVVEMQIQRSSVYNSRVVLPTLQLGKEQAANRIARLVGVAPGELELSDLGLDSLTFPAQIQGISSAYILRRPDIQAVEAAMLAADADIDVARKAVLPSLELASEVGFGSTKVSDLFQPHTLMWNFIANLTATVFDGGRREQQIKFAQAVRAELVETYVFNVYSGLQQARDALNGIEFTERRLGMQKTSTEAAKQALDLGLESYRAGGIDFLTFLDSTHSYQRRRDELFTFYLEYYQSFIDLYGALGGGIPYRGAYYGKSDVKASIAALEAREQEEVEEYSGPSWVEGEEGWLVEPESYQSDEGDWLVRLSGVFDAFATESVLKDFRHRYKDIRPAKALLAERIGFNDQEKERQASWYALDIAGFENQDEAEQWCTMLRETQQRCIVFQAEDSFEVDGVFVIDDTSADEQLATTILTNQEPEPEPEPEIVIISPDWVEGEEGWLNTTEIYKSGEIWLVRLSGGFDRTATESLVEQLKGDLEEGMVAKAVLAEQIAGDDSADMSGTLYALDVMGFADKQQAKEWCAWLKESQQSCIVFLSDEYFDVDALFLLDDESREAVMANLDSNIQGAAQLQALAEAKAKKEEPALAQQVTTIVSTSDNSATTQDVVLDERGRLYSLLKSDGTNAWLIGNNSFRVWKYDVGSELHSNGRIVALKKDQAVLRFDNTGVRLQPLYVVDSVESRDDGSAFAYLRWGSARAGRIYSHRVGDRVYGGGTIKAIDEAGVTVTWGSYDVLLEVK